MGVLGILSLSFISAGTNGPLLLRDLLLSKGALPPALRLCAFCYWPGSLLLALSELAPPREPDIGA